MRKLKVCIMLFFLVLYGIPVHAASYYTEGYFQYHLKDTYASICGYFGKEEVVRIPSALGGKPVKEIEDYSFQNAEGVQEIQIPATVLSIGDNAFTGAEELKRVEKDALENQKPEGGEGDDNEAEGSEDSTEGSDDSSDTQKPQDQLPGNNTSGQPEENAPVQADDDAEQPDNTVQKEESGQSDPISPEADPEGTKEPENITEYDQVPESITETQQGQTSGATQNSAVQEADGESEDKKAEEYEETKIVSSALRETPVGEMDFSETGQELLPEEETEYLSDSVTEKVPQNTFLIQVWIVCAILVLAGGLGVAMYRLRKKNNKG